MPPRLNVIQAQGLPIHIKRDLLYVRGEGRRWLAKLSPRDDHHFLLVLTGRRVMVLTPAHPLWSGFSN